VSNWLTMDLSRSARVRETEVMVTRLMPWEECFGLCHKIELDNDLLVTHIGKISIVLPIEMASRFRELEGKWIGVLRTDRDYKIRILDDQNRIGSNF
jgi:hypothetical protein